MIRNRAYSMLASLAGVLTYLNVVADTTPTPHEQLAAYTYTQAQRDAMYIANWRHDISDADCAYVQFDAEGKVKWAVRKGGTMLKVAGKPVACEEMQPVGPSALP